MNAGVSLVYVPVEAGVSPVYVLVEARVSSVSGWGVAWPGSYSRG